MYRICECLKINVGSVEFGLWLVSISYPTGDSVQVLVDSRCQLYPSKGYIKAMLSQGYAKVIGSWA